MLIITMKDNDNRIDIKFSAFFKANYSKIRKYAYKFLKSEFDAEDVAQEVFIKLWEQQGIWLDNERKLDAYLLIMTRNIALNILKHQQIKQEYQDYFYEESSNRLADDDFLERIYGHELLQVVHAILETVPERRRLAFVLSRFEGIKHRDIAYRMNISVHTVDRQIYLTRAILRKALFST